jgi:hypothetical protein
MSTPCCRPSSDIYLEETKSRDSFYRVGGGTRIAGFLLAVATAILLFVGTGPIVFLRMF